MTWLNPAAFAFLALIPVVLLLHALRHRRRDVRVSTLFLWESVLREAHGNLGLQRLVQNLPLLLQLLLVCVLTAVLANPVLTKTVAENKDIVLVLDVECEYADAYPAGHTFCPGATAGARGPPGVAEGTANGAHYGGSTAAGGVVLYV